MASREGVRAGRWDYMFFKNLGLRLCFALTSCRLGARWFSGHHFLNFAGFHRIKNQMRHICELYTSGSQSQLCTIITYKAPKLQSIRPQPR